MARRFLSVLALTPLWSLERHVDYELSVKAAQASRDAGVERLVFVSSMGAKAGSSLSAYAANKGDAEAEMAAMGWPRGAAMVRPGMFVEDGVERTNGRANKSRGWLKSGLMKVAAMVAPSNTVPKIVNAVSTLAREEGQEGTVFIECGDINGM